MNVHSVFALLLVVVSLSLAAADRLKDPAAACSISDRDEGAADTREAAQTGGYWLAWTEAAAH